VKQDFLEKLKVYFSFII